MNELPTMIVDDERMTSLQIAEITGKPHNDVMKAIRKMEPAWEKVQGGNFSLMQEQIEISNGGHKMRPYYSLNKEECLYIATKFNDEARAKLIKQWKELEEQHQKPSVPQNYLEALKGKGILPLIEQENTPRDKGTGGRESSKTTGASQQTINFE